MVSRDAKSSEHALVFPRSRIPLRRLRVAANRFHSREIRYKTSIA